MSNCKHFLDKTVGDIASFKHQLQQTTSLEKYPYASDIQQNIVVYECQAIEQAAMQPETRRALMSEMVEVWSSGPGILMIKQAMDHDVVDQASEVFQRIIDTQKESSQGGGDHFAKAGANDRIWNALEKHGRQAPESFCQYYANLRIAMVAEAWLGPGYQITAQVNRVNPGGKAQSAHRDYHLGFMTGEQIAHYPKHVQYFSPLLTLQGAIAHCDMPLETGPTLYLPYSQNYEAGYLAFERPEFQEYFTENHSQLALKKGDMVFFNPALMHAAGSNTTSDQYRLANLLQISSAFGRPMEAIDYTQLTEAVYPELLNLLTNDTLNTNEACCAINACTEGYPFPTNLDTDPPVNGLAPLSQRAITLDAMQSNTSPQALIKLLNQKAIQRQA